MSSPAIALPLDIRHLFHSLIDDIIYSAVEHGSWIGHAQIAEPENRCVSKASKIHNLPVVCAMDNKLIQPKVLKQYVFNFCGYHALFSVLNLMNYFSFGFEKYLHNIRNSAEFWRFKVRTSQFLQKFAKSKKLYKEKLWSDKWCQIGDLERIHLKAIIGESGEFISTFGRHPDFVAQHFTLEFQFNQFVTPTEQLSKFQNLVDAFRSVTHGAFAVFVGACNHWVAFIAHFAPHRREYVFLDPRNVDYLLWSDAQIEEGIEKFAQQRIRDGMKPYCNFRKMVAKQCIRDIQASAEFLVNVFEGKWNAIDYFTRLKFKEYYESNYASFFESARLLLEEKSYEEVIALCGSEFHTLKHSTEHLSNIVAAKSRLSEQSLGFLRQIVNKYRKLFVFIRTNLKERWAKKIGTDLEAILTLQ